MLQRSDNDIERIYGYCYKGFVEVVPHSCGHGVSVLLCNLPIQRVAVGLAG